ncbi:MAG: HAD-IA family hydrolase [Candidatus Dormibacteraeota bacterium]|nr:HAD-IA family hydrolase [Candidatus Dormibacteraeota bacterium]
MQRTEGFHGAVFDVDGVLVDSPHEEAWRESLNDLMEGEWSDLRAQSGYSPDFFTPEVYQRVMSGKPRMSGALAALQHFGIPQPEQHVARYAERKQERLLELIEAGRFHAFPDALRFVLAVKNVGIRIAAASSSKNAGLFLGRIELAAFAEKEGLPHDFLTSGATLLDALDADVSGRDFAHGKPHPMIFLAAVEELGLAPESCFVVEDAANGVEAAKGGHMAALAVARADDVVLLAQAGADLVVTSLDQVAVEGLARGRLEQVAVGGRREGG